MPSQAALTAPTAPPTLQALHAGQLVNGTYRLTRFVGVGGMGQVWEGLHLRTKSRIALKALLPQFGLAPPVLSRFQAEAEIASSLNHPNIVRVTDFDRLPDGRPYLVMEFLEGRDLSAAIKERGRFSPAEAADIIEQIARGLQAAHDHLIIHRDLKPANVFLVALPGEARPLVKVLDFGVSKVADAVLKLTSTQNLLGTPQYMAPEQACGSAAGLDMRADQFSLAAIAYELLTGSMAFDGDTVINVLHRVVNETPRSFDSLGLTEAGDLEAVIARGLSKSPEQRFASVTAFAAAFKAAAIPHEGPVVLGQPLSGQPTMAAPVRDTTLRSAAAAIDDQPLTLDDLPAIPMHHGGRRWVIAAGALLAAGMILLIARRGPPSGDDANGGAGWRAAHAPAAAFQPAPAATPDSGVENDPQAGNRNLAPRVGLGGAPLARRRPPAPARRPLQRGPINEDL